MSIDLPTEIIIEIMNHLYFPYSWPPPIQRNLRKKPFDDALSKKSLHAMALTCQSFSSPALDLLWEYMDDILPLFRLLSGWNDDVRTIWEPVTDEELDRFNSYARRIKYYFRRPMGEGIPLRVYRHMMALNQPTACLLPRLKYLAIQDGITVTFDHEAMSEVVYLLSPQLSHLFIKDAGFALEESDFVRSIIGALPLKTQLTHLSLACPLTSATFERICQIPGLYYLSLSETLTDTDPFLIGSNFFHSISAASNHTLHEISLKSYHFEDTVTMSSVITLPVLKKFSCSLTSNDLGVIQQLVSTAELPSLERLELLFIPVASTSNPSWPEFWSTLAATTALRELVLDNDHSIFLDMPMSSFPEFVRNDLTSLHVVGRVFRRLTPTDWTNFVRSRGLRNLESLVLVEEQVELVGYQALIDIASNMSLLKELTISLETSLPPTTQEIVPILNHGLRRIDFSRTTFEYPLTFARCLDRLFPTLESIDCRFQVKRRKRKFGPDPRGCRQVQSALLDLRERRIMAMGS